MDILPPDSNLSGGSTRIDPHGSNPKPARSSRSLEIREL